MSELRDMENCSFFLFNIKLSSLRSELAACNFRNRGLVSSQELPWGSEVIFPWSVGPVTAQDDEGGAALPPFPPLKWCFFVLFFVFLVAVLGKYPTLGIYLSLKVLGLYPLKLKEGKQLQVYGGRFALFRDIMFLVSALSIFIATSAYLQLIFLPVEKVLLKEWWGKWSESHSCTVTVQASRECTVQKQKAVKDHMSCFVQDWGTVAVCPPSTGLHAALVIP